MREQEPESTRPDLAETLRRRSLTRDAGRADVTARRHAAGRRTARENLADLCDDGSFVEYGSLAIAAQRGRRSVDDLVKRTPADGLVAGVARVNSALVGADRAHCAVLSYDYTVLAGTQGAMGHRKKDRLFEVIERRRLPVVLFAEGGGGRPGDTDQAMVAGLDVMAFALWARLSGLVPRIGIASGRCFAGNAALLGCSDLIIATPDASIGMGGPAMIEGGGLGVVNADQVGPFDVQVKNGVIDIAATDEADAVRLARRALSFFQGPIAAWQAPDQDALRDVVPENRRRAYDVHRAIEIIADTDSSLELRPGFGRGMVTVLARIEGHPVGIVANNPMHLAGAITSDCADKAARFLQLCEAFRLPVLFLCDTPGIMVGPDAEATALVRHASRLFLAGAALTVPFMTVVLRKGYGLGAQAMAGGSFRAPLMTVAWPTGEFGGMGLEGAVKLGYRKELEAISDAEARAAQFDAMVADAYARGTALNTATYFEIDDVVDPAATRDLAAAVIINTGASQGEARKRAYVDAW
jgi:acetyl-CoA carboxylase carboxyltransferase component